MEKTATATRTVTESNEMVARRVEVIKLTPEKAAELLGRNYHSNRKLNKRKVGEYVKLMEDGKWNPYLGDMMRVADDGTLIDGQHRCHAVLVYGKPVEVLYCGGFKTSDYGYVDAGTARRGADAIRHVPYANNTAAFLLCAANVNRYGLTSDGLNSHTAIPNSEYPEWLELLGTDNVFRWVSLGTKVSTRLHGTTIAYSMFAAITEAIDQENHEKFFDELLSPLVVNYTIAAFRERMSKLFLDRVRTRPYDVFKLLCATWNAYVEGREIRRLVMPEKVSIVGLQDDVNVIQLLADKE